MSKIDVHIGLGSNLGDRAGNLKRAIALFENSLGQIISLSPIYETEPWGNVDQPNFLNQVVKINTEVSPLKIMDVLLKIEAEMGRLRVEKWGPRLIDLDFLMWNENVIRIDGLILPHPEMHKRMFVLKPLSDIDPDIIHPVLKVKMSTLLEQCSEKSSITLFND